MSASSLSLPRRILRSIFGSRNERLLKRMRKTVEAVNALEPALATLTDTELAAKTVEFRTRLAQGATVESLLPEAFAEVARILPFPCWTLLKGRGPCLTTFPHS